MTVIFSDALVKPWPVRSTSAATTESTSKRELNQEHSMIPDLYSDDINKIDTLLKHARLIRQQQEEPPQKSIENRPVSANKKKQTQKLDSKLAVDKKKSSLVKSSIKTTKEIPSGCNKTGKSLYVVSQKRMAANSRTKTPLASAGDLKSLKPTSQSCTAPTQPSIDSHNFLQLEDVIKERFLPSKYVKLRHMHDKLKIGVSNADRRTCESEASFISKLSGSGNSHFGDDTFSTVDAANSLITSEIDKVEFLLNTLEYKLSYSDRDTSPVALYYQKLAYTRFINAVSEVDYFYSQLKNSFVITSATCSSEHQNIISRCCRRPKFPCQFQKFEKETEVVQNSDVVNDIRWLKLNLFLKRRLHDVLTTILRETADSRQENNAGLNRDATTLLTSAFGLLAKVNRCAINPAVVKSD